MDSECFQIAWLGKVERDNKKGDESNFIWGKNIFLENKNAPSSSWTYINEKMILNFDQIPGGFTSPNLTTCTDKISGYMSMNEKLDRFVNELFNIELFNIELY